MTEGLGRIQARGGDVIEIRAGDTIYTAPGEWHWHGSAPNRFMTHLAIWEAPADGPESEWGLQVTDAECMAQEDDAARNERSGGGRELARLGPRCHVQRVG